MHLQCRVVLPFEYAVGAVQFSVLLTEFLSGFELRQFGVEFVCAVMVSLTRKGLYVPGLLGYFGPPFSIPDRDGLVYEGEPSNHYFHLVGQR